MDRVRSNENFEMGKDLEHLEKIQDLIEEKMGISSSFSFIYCPLNPQELHLQVRE